MSLRKPGSHNTPLGGGCGEINLLTCIVFVSHGVHANIIKLGSHVFIQQMAKLKKERKKKEAVRKVKRKLEKNVNSYSSHHVSATSSAETNRLESSNLFFFFFDPKKKIVCRLFKVCAYFSDLVAVQDLFSEETNSIAQD